jgi:hypothetical protein
MVQGVKTIDGSSIKKFKIFYVIGIGLNLIFSIGHFGYAFMEYDTLDESALWFFSGGLAFLFNTGLNTLCLLECNKLNHIITMIANLALLIFSIVLAIVVTEIQTVCFVFVVLYTSMVCYNHSIRMLQKQI